MTTDNPYSSPSVQSSAEVQAAVEVESLGAIARATFLAWEKLRLVYIAILAAVALLAGMLGEPALIGSLRFWLIVVQGAIVANVCFFAGPIIETYVRWLGFRAAWLRILLFVFGTLFSCALALGVIVGELLTAVD